MIMMMINNGGGCSARDHKLDVVTPRNIEAMQFVQELVKAKISDPASVSYTTSTRIPSGSREVRHGYLHRWP